MPKYRKYGSKEQHHFISGTYVAIALFLVLFQIFTSVFTLPILIGFFFCYMFVLLRERELTLYELDFRWYFSLAYLVFIDITHDFYLFSSLIAFVIFYYFCADWLRTNFKIGKFLPIFFVIFAYGLLFVVHNLILYVDSGEFRLFGVDYGVNMLAEAALCFFFFRNKIK